MTTNKFNFTFDDLLYIQQSVIDWNIIFGIKPEDSQYVSLYHSLSKEEFNGKGEFYPSLMAGEIEGIADGLGDMCFTVFQWAVLDGNMMLDNYDRSWFDKIVVGNLVHDQHVSELDKHLVEGNSFGAQTSLIHLLYYYSRKEYDVMGIFNRIKESNYSKAVKKEKVVDVQDEIDYIKEQGRYGDISCEEVVAPNGEEYYIFKAGQDVRSGVVFDKPKVIKSRQFVSVEELGGLYEFIFV